jgi:ABC-type antimicrobial peptide transport system permease subunit
MFILGYFTFKDLIHDRWRSLLTIGSLSVVVVAYLLLAALSHSLQSVGRQNRVTNNLVILSAEALDPMESSLEETVLQMALQAAPGKIGRVFPTLFHHLNIDGQIMQVRAVPLEEMPAALGLTLVQGAWPSGTHQVVIAEEIARATPWKTGSTINIYGTDFQVSGLVRSSESNIGAIWMNYTEGQLLFGTQHGFQVGYLSLAPSADPESVRAMLQDAPGISADYTVYLENAVSQSLSQVSYNLVILSGIMAVVSLLAITFGIYNSTNLSLTERSHEIQLLRLVGFTQDRLRRFLLARALVLTLSAYGLGWAVMHLYFNYRNLHAPLGVSEVPLNLVLTPTTSLLGILLAAVFAFLGVWLTSRRFAAQSPLIASD